MSPVGNETGKILETFPSWAENNRDVSQRDPDLTEQGSGLFMAMTVSGLHPIALIKAPYQFPSWCVGALE